MAKNIVVFSDGTGQEGGRGYNSNVYRLFNMCEDRTDRQILFYDRGLGTGWRKITGNLFGAGISKNIKDCYRFIFENFNAEDEIFLFGFSRGATTVRSLSSFIHLFGILPKSRPELIDHAYRIYKDRKGREKRAKEFLQRHNNMWCRIRFIGVWDTVAALGIPVTGLNAILEQLPGMQHRFQDLRISKSVEHGRHALAIDDERAIFHPLPWEEKCEDYQTVEQVWFPGMHTDIGGGYRETGLADNALDWMVREATNKGLRIYSGHQVKIDPDPDGFMHDSRGTFWTSLYRRKVREWNRDTHGTPLVHSSVLKRTKDRYNQDAAYKPWILEQPVEEWTGSHT